MWKIQIVIYVMNSKELLILMLPKMEVVSIGLFWFCFFALFVKWSVFLVRIFSKRSWCNKKTLGSFVHNTDDISVIFLGPITSPKVSAHIQGIQGGMMDRW